MPNKYFVGGAEAFVALKNDDESVEAFRSLGDVNVFSPTMDNTVIRRQSPVSGKLRTTDERVTATDEKYSLEDFDVLDLTVLMLLFGGEIVNYSQSATPLVDVEMEHPAGPGTVIPLCDANGKHMMPITSVAAVKTGTTTLVLGTDYTADADDLKFGVIRILDDAPNIDPDSTVTVSFTPTAISNQKRLIYPQSLGIVNARAFFVWKQPGQDGSLADVLARTGGDSGEGRQPGVDVTIKSTGSNFLANDYSNIQIEMTVISDNAVPSQPAGRLIAPIGTTIPA